MTTLRILHLACLVMTAGSLSAQTHTENISNATDMYNEAAVVNLIDHLSSLSTNKVRPGVYGNATVVYIQFFLRSFGRLDAKEMEFSVDIDLRQTWTDKRLCFNSSQTTTPVYIPYHNIDKFWLPDVYFPNEKDASKQLPNRSFRIYPNGTVRYVTRHAMRLSCTLYLARYPLDKQKCFIKISTYSYDMRAVVLQWEDDYSMELHAEKLNLPQFELTDNYHSECTDEQYRTGNYSCLASALLLKRKVGFFILQYYIPSMLIVVISWVGFWINKNSDPARVSLGVTTVLTMTTIAATSRDISVSYLKALDVWYAVCSVFVFGSLLEYAFVNVFARSEKHKLEGVQPASTTLEELTPMNKSSTTESEMQCRQIVDWIAAERMIDKWNITAKAIDRISRRVFPVCFLTFNIIYWLTYAVFTNTDD